MIPSYLYLSKFPRSRRLCVPASTIRRIVLEEYQDCTAAQIARMCGFKDESSMRQLLGGERSTYDWMTFNKADTILTKLGLHHLWHTDPELVEVYEYLDRAAREHRDRRASYEALYRNRPDVRERSRRRLADSYASKKKREISKAEDLDTLEDVA